jgi:hypothetical protein
MPPFDTKNSEGAKATKKEEKGGQRPDDARFGRRLERGKRNWQQWPKEKGEGGTA